MSEDSDMASERVDIAALRSGVETFESPIEAAIREKYGSYTNLTTEQPETIIRGTPVMRFILLEKGEDLETKKSKKKAFFNLVQDLDRFYPAVQNRDARRSLFRKRTLLQTMTVTWANCVYDFFRAVDLSPFPGHPSR